MSPSGLSIPPPSQVKGSFDLDAMAEHTMLHRAYGERDLARALDAHIRSMRRLRAMKHAGHSGWEAWRGFFAEAAESERREITRRAQARKVELGLWDAEEGPEAEARVVAEGGAEAEAARSTRRAVAGPRRQPGVPAEWLARQQQVRALVREREQRERERAAEAEAKAGESSGEAEVEEQGEQGRDVSEQEEEEEEEVARE